MNLTLEERERLAYINGDVQLAAALRSAVDLYNLGAADEEQDDMIEKAEHELQLSDER